MSSDLKVDPLYTIFEKHLYDVTDKAETEDEFIEKIVVDYLKFLTTQKVAIPQRWHGQIVEELRDQVRKMMVKKMYGCLSIQEFVINQKDRREKKKKAKKKYSKLF